MVFSSIVFLFTFLPLVLLIYYILPRKFRNIFLFIVNLIFYGWGEPVFILIMVFSTITDYINGYFIEKYRGHKWLPKAFLVLAITLNILLLGFFKYANFVADLLSPLIPNIALPQIPLPIGISFYTFQTMSYIIDVYRGDAKAQKNIMSFGMYIALFPQLVAGPIVRYKDIAHQITHRKETLLQFANGVRLFIVGLAKKVLIANQMGMLWDQLQQTAGVNGIAGAWIGICAYAFQIYFDFSGYSDMARGLGNMLGFEFLINFNYPYISKSITEFWRRWHISLGTWFRHYVYIPLGGSRKGTGRLLLSLLIVWFLTGLWHGASWNFVMWGLFYGFILMIEKLFLLKRMEKIPNFIRRTYAMILVLIGWVIFYFEDTGAMTSYLVKMFTFSNGWIGADALALFLQNLPLMLVAAIASTPMARDLYVRLRERKGFTAVELAICATALIICTATLVSQTYNPFLYFRF
ncbi:MAG: MBOAT family O-acyltransferase [Christensenellales bacterium]